MKIGILTQPLANNYGGILQNFALQTTLRRLGHSVITINIPQPLREEKLDFFRCLWRLTKRIKGDGNILFLNANKQINFFNTPGIEQERFINKYIDKIDLPKGIDNFFYKQHTEFDALIVGSDQVWRKAFSPNLPTYFFAEAPEAIKKVAYAVSFGCDTSDIPLQEISYYSSLAKKFDAISVREKTGIDICRDFLHVDAELVLDPTLLLNAIDYVDLLKIKKGSTNKSNVAAIYILDRNNQKQRIIDEVCRSKKLIPRYIGVPTKKGFSSIENWIETICNANYVITDSFHGTVFSIIFQKNFITICNRERGSARFESLMKIMCLEDRLVDSKKKVDNMSYIEDIDYSLISPIIEIWKEKSLLFLNSSLQK